MDKGIIIELNKLEFEGDLCMRIYDKDKLDNHYNNILKNNIDKIMLGGVGDTLLYDAKDDARMSLVVLIRMSSNITNNIIRHMEELKLLEPDLYYYPQEDFHITVMDILKGELGRTIPANINEYINTISRCAEEISAFEILFDGMTASDNVALVKGYYEESLEVFRKMLRDNLKQQGLPLEERYETFSSHISVARIPNKLKNPNEYIDFIGRNCTFGIMKVKSFEICFHNWYDSQKTVLRKIQLRT